MGLIGRRPQEYGGQGHDDRHFYDAEASHGLLPAIDGDDPLEDRRPPAR
jgi:hypothetical protein